MKLRPVIPYEMFISFMLGPCRSFATVIVDWSMSQDIEKKNCFKKAPVI